MKNICSVLIVDDSESDRYLLKRIIKDAELSDQIFEADDGKTAIEFLKNHQKKREEFPDKFPPPVIFLDINMPLVDGFEFLDQFSNLRNVVYKFESVVFLMVTSSDREEDKKRAMRFNFVKDYIVKSNISSDVLREKVLKLFNLHQRKNGISNQEENEISNQKKKKYA